MKNEKFCCKNIQIKMESGKDLNFLLNVQKKHKSIQPQKLNYHAGYFELTVSFDNLDKIIKKSEV